MPSNDNYKSLIDDLGVVRAEIADLLRQERFIKRQLDGLGVGTHEGTLFRVAIVDTVKKRLDMKAVRAKLTPQFIRAHTKQHPDRSYRVSARSGENLSPEIQLEPEEI